MSKPPEVKIVEIRPNGEVIFEYGEDFVEFVKKQKGINTITEEEIKNFLVNAITQKASKNLRK